MCAREREEAEAEAEAEARRLWEGAFPTESATAEPARKPWSEEGRGRRQRWRRGRRRQTRTGRTTEGASTVQRRRGAEAEMEVLMGLGGIMDGEWTDWMRMGRQPR